jgi:hypothetical protein
MRKKIAPIALGLALAIGTQGCYGRFQLVRSLYKWNGTVGEKFVNELVFLGCIILPVYSIAGFVDAVILNTIEFWSGKNPMTAKVITQGDKQVSMNYDKATGIVAVRAYDKGVLLSETFLKKDGDRILTLDKAGKVLYTASADMNGTASLADAKGLILAQSTQQ